MRAALIPMKDLAQSKMRLADVLDRSERAELALAMLTDVITACNESACFDLVAVISRDSDVFWHARELGAKALPEPATLQGLNESLTFGQRYLARRMGAAELLVLPADIPLVRADDIHAVLDALRAPICASIVRAHDGGTNAFGLRPPETLPMRFGPQSADAHVASARDARVPIAEVVRERLAFDIDTPDDLQALSGMPAGAATAGWLEARAHYADERAAGERAG